MIDFSKSEISVRNEDIGRLKFITNNNGSIRVYLDGEQIEHITKLTFTRQEVVIERQLLRKEDRENDVWLKK